MRLLLTGGAGFIGHHLVEHVLRETDWKIVCLDRLDTSGNLNRLAEVLQSRKDPYRVKVVYHDLRAPVSDLLKSQIGHIDQIWHVAAATHVDRSIDCPMEFVQDNVVATCNILDYARSLDGLKRFLFFSTDEVFGPAPEGTAYQEDDRYHSGNPYAATKAGAEELCVAYANTYRLPVVITHTMNVFGERQHPEKFIPSTIAKVRDGKKVVIHANQDKTKAGSRFYIHARNVASALMYLEYKYVAPGDKLNIVGEQEVSNLQMAQMIASIQGKPLKYEMVDFHSSRPGHDLRYALNGDKMRKLGWTLPVNFEKSLERTVAWTLKHPHWL